MLNVYSSTSLEKMSENTKTISDYLRKYACLSPSLHFWCWWARLILTLWKNVLGDVLKWGSFQVIEKIYSICFWRSIDAIVSLAVTSVDSFRRWSVNTSNSWFLVVTAFTCVSLRQSDINLAWPLSFHRCKAIHFHYLVFLHLPHCFLMISNWAWQVYSYTTSLIYSRAKLSFNITTSANRKSTKINPAVLLCWKKTVDAYISDNCMALAIQMNSHKV